MTKLSAIILLVLAATLPAMAEPAAEPVAGELLIASAAIQDPRFHHAVILLLRHDDKGAFGIVINHPLTERPIASLLAESGGQADQDAQDSAIEGTQNLLCAGLAVGVLAGLLGNALFGLWWVDPAAALVISAAAVQGGSQAWKGEGCEACC